MATHSKANIEGVHHGFILLNTAFGLLYLPYFLFHHLFHPFSDFQKLYMIGLVVESGTKYQNVNWEEFVLRMREELLESYFYTPIVVFCLFLCLLMLVVLDYLQIFGINQYLKYYFLSCMKSLNFVFLGAISRSVLSIQQPAQFPQVLRYRSPQSTGACNLLLSLGAWSGLIYFTHLYPIIQNKHDRFLSVP